jgi:type II secretory ATPase GspE/PulE/Tfp pilus assembly ATPase PilB-like protein
LGVERIDVAAALRLAMSQRLVRVLCGNCKEKTQPEKTLLERARHALASIPPQSGIKIPREPEFFRSRGCSACAGLSYKGRVGIFEAFTVTEEIAKLISAGASSRELRKEAIHEGMLTMAQDGVLKALSGITDLEEVFRVTEE